MPWFNALSYQLVLFLQPMKCTTAQTSISFHPLSRDDRSQHMKQDPLWHYHNYLCYSAIFDAATCITTHSDCTMSPQSIYHQDYTTVLSSIPWQAYDLCTMLSGISRHVAPIHPSYDAPSTTTEHIKYHPPDSQPIRHSPMIPQLYCPQSLPATQTQYSPQWPPLNGPYRKPWHFITVVKLM